MKIKDLSYIALLAAIMGVLGLMPPIALPFTPVPITLQTLGVILSGGLLGAKRGALSQLLFLALVAAGVPLLSGGRGGMSVFFGPSAGFLISWPVTAFVLGLLLARFKNLKLWHTLAVNLTVGIFLIYLIGVPVQAAIMKIGVWEAAKVSLAFIPGDVLKAMIGSLVVYRLRNNAYFAKMIASEKRQIKEMHEAS